MKELPVNTIVCGDNVQVMSEWPDECIDMFLTSPPYDNLRTYNGFEWDFDLLADQLWRVMKLGAVGVWVVGDATINGSETGSSFRQALGFMERGFRLHDTMIYERWGRFPDVTRYWQNFEYMFVFSKGKPNTVNRLTRKNINAGKRNTGTKRTADGRLIPQNKQGQRKYGKEGTRGNVWKYDVGNGHTGDPLCHEAPAAFPEKLAKDHILSWSNPGDIVLDCFMGSGTTGKMAALTDRHFIGIDISQEYVNLAERRIAAVKQQPRLFAWDMTPAI